VIISSRLSRVQHDPRVCGLNPEWDCPECRTKREVEDQVRHPHLTRPGPQPWNQLPAFSAYHVLPNGCIVPPPERPQPLVREEAVRLAATVQAYPDLFLPIILEQLAEPLGELIAALKSQEQPRREGVAA
jgi:hypothetical protein